MREWKKDLEAVIEAMATADVFYQKVYIIDFVELLLDEQRHELTHDKCQIQMKNSKSVSGGKEASSLA